MMMSVAMDVRVIVDWLRADNFTSKQLIAVRKPALTNISVCHSIYNTLHLFTKYLRSLSLDHCVHMHGY